MLRTVHTHNVGVVVVEVLPRGKRCFARFHDAHPALYQVAGAIGETADEALHNLLAAAVADFPRAAVARSAAPRETRRAASMSAPPPVPPAAPAPNSGM